MSIDLHTICTDKGWGILRNARMFPKNDLAYRFLNTSFMISWLTDGWKSSKYTTLTHVNISPLWLQYHYYSMEVFSLPLLEYLWLQSILHSSTSHSLSSQTGNYASLHSKKQTTSSTRMNPLYDIAYTEESFALICLQKSTCQEQV